MRRSSTDRALRWALALALAAAPVRAGAEGPPAPAGGWRGSATPGLTLNFPTGSFDDPDTTSWFEQWEYLAHPDAAVPWWLDLLHSELGYARDDGTWLAHIERWSPFDYGENTLLDADWRGLRVEGQAHRWRTGELRETPLGTGDTGANVLPRLGSHYNDLTDPDDVFYTRRYGGGGEVRLRPDGFGHPGWPLTQLSFYGSHERRTGKNQDTFLLQPDEVGNGPEDARFRGLSTDFDQDVTTLGARMVANPWNLATGVLDLSWQRFLDNDPAFLVGDLAALDPVLRPTPEAAQNAILFVPDSKRLTGSLLVSRRIGDASVNVGAFATRLAQDGTRTPLERQANFDDNHVTTISTHAAANVPINDWVDVDAYGKWALRKNEIPYDTPLFADDNRTQLAPLLRRLEDWRGGVEVVGKPMAGSRVAAGFRMIDVDRELDFALPDAADGFPQNAIYPAVSLIRDDSKNRSYYLRGHARLLKRTRVSGEVGYAWSPEIGMPNELEHAAYAEGRLTQGLRAPVPVTLALFGHWRDGRSNGEFVLESIYPDRSQSKDYENRTADWGASVTALPTRSTALWASYVQQQIHQHFPHVRSNVPRPNGADFVRFYLDSEIGWDSDVKVFAWGGSQQLTHGLDFSLSSWWMLANGNWAGSSPMGTSLSAVNRIDLRQLSVEAAFGLALRPDLRLGLAYRFSRFRNEAQMEFEPSLDGQLHSVTLSATYDFDLAGR